MIGIALFISSLVVFCKIKKNNSFCEYVIKPDSTLKKSVSDDMDWIHELHEYDEYRPSPRKLYMHPGYDYPICRIFHNCTETDFTDYSDGTMIYYDRDDVELLDFSLEALNGDKRLYNYYTLFN